MNRTYISIYGHHIRQFVEMKRTLGFKFTTTAVILRQIDTLANKTGETSLGITKWFADTWSKKRSYESDAYHYDRVRTLAMLSSYMSDRGVPSFIPKVPRYKPSTFIPYIYSAKELDAVFKACDELRLDKANMASSLFSVPTLIRLLFCTGLRINEALALKNDDVDLEDKYIRVRDSKNGKERLIPISESLTGVCKEYVRYRDKLPVPNAKSIHFFVSLNGSKCSYRSITAWFKKCLKKVGILYVGRNRLPRIHDLSYPNKKIIQTFLEKAWINHAQPKKGLGIFLSFYSMYTAKSSQTV